MLISTVFLVGTYLIIICILSQDFLSLNILHDFLKFFFFKFVLDLHDWDKLCLIINDFKCSVFSRCFHKRDKPLTSYLFPISSLCFPPHSSFSCHLLSSPLLLSLPLSFSPFLLSSSFLFFSLPPLPPTVCLVSGVPLSDLGVKAFTS